MVPVHFHSTTRIWKPVGYFNLHGYESSSVPLLSFPFLSTLSMAAIIFTLMLGPAHSTLLLTKLPGLSSSVTLSWANNVLMPQFPRKKQGKILAFTS
jgi:hypothetical protein